MSGIKIITRFGELNVDPSQVITFPRGIPGFENSTKWMLFHEVDEHGNWSGGGVVVYLQSLDDGDIALPLTDPTLFGFNFDLVLSDSEVAELQFEDPSDVLVLTTLSVRGASGNVQHPAMTDMYANISAPILINTKARIGMQKMLVARDSRVDFHTTP